VDRWLAPGGAGDIQARIMGRWLTERLGRPVIIENKPGAGSNISVQSLIGLPADGHTLLFVSPAQAINATLYERYRSASWQILRLSRDCSARRW
jgi:tripartite-type tricarboxylate transporter receptor subunit TctC